jgi:hypothetical protein
MRLTLALRTPDGTTWRRQVERDYPGVPRPGDWVYLADTDHGTGLFATPVSLVSFENDGRLTLTFDFPDASQAAQLEAFGFTRP